MRLERDRSRIERRTGVRPSITHVSVIGTGVIGRSWIQVFARAGCKAHVYDAIPEQADRAREWLEKELDLDVKDRRLTPEQAAKRIALVSVHRDLGEALEGAGYVQESVREDLKSKQEVYAKLDRLATKEAILASSTSALDMTEMAANLAGAHRCVVAHPVNPPHIIPLVEVMPGKRTAADILNRTRKFLLSVGQKPVMMRFYLPGFLLNRMQTALLREAINLVESGVADVDDVDSTVRDGLGLRWALLGPFGVAQTNADGGVREYFARYQQTYTDIAKDLRPMPSFNAELIEKLGRGADGMYRGVSERELLRWRDRLIGKILKLKEEEPLSRRRRKTTRRTRSK
jgi:3-hydroxyacyl-CoA dehydrogenase